MATPIAFVSDKVIDKKRDVKRKAQAIILQKAKEKYEREERKQKLKKERGEDKWMLPSVNDALEDKTARRKRRKKEKREKKKKRKKQETKEETSSSSSDHDDEEEWVEAGSSGAGHNMSSPSKEEANSSEMTTTVGVPQPVQRDNWMESPFLTATYSSSEVRKKREEKRKQEKDKERSLHSIDNVGQSVRELNPFWKDGGTGLPDEEPEKVTSSPGAERPVGVADRGSSWLRKSYNRVKQQAQDEGRSFEKMAAERWGSLEKIHSLLAEADGPRHQRVGDSPRWKTERYEHRGGDQVIRGGGSRERRRHVEDHERDGYKRRDPGTGHRTEGFHTSRRRSGENVRHSHVESHQKTVFKKPSEDDDNYEGYPSSRRREGDQGLGISLATMQGKFKKPCDEEDSPSTMGRSNLHQRAGSQAWRKSEYSKPHPEDLKDADSSRAAQDRRTDKGEEADSQMKRMASATKDVKRDGSSSPSSSSSDDDDDAGEKEEIRENLVLTKDEMNQLGAKVVKAEIMGNQKLADELKRKLEASRNASLNQPKLKPEKIKVKTTKDSHMSDSGNEEVILSRTNRTGHSYPLPESVGQLETGKHRNKKGVSTHDKDGQRERYYGDDDNMDLKTMVQRERMGLAEDQNQIFARAQAKALKSLNDDFSLDDMFVSNVNKHSDRGEERRQRDRAIREHQRMETSLSRCPYCIDSPEMKKHLIIALGIKVYLCLPRTQSLTQGHCLIVPMQHSQASTSLDEDVWNEVQIFRKGLAKMFEDHELDPIFMEMSSDYKKGRHMCLECIPVPKETGDMAPIYFKKAIQESETEWSQNKKLIDTRKKGIRNSVPKGFPYFSVDFGLDGGFAHVIEDEQLFPHFFGKEIVGGMMDLEPRMWRNPHKENFDTQRTKVLEFAEWWKPFDWTKKIDRDNV